MKTNRSLSATRCRQGGFFLVVVMVIVATILLLLLAANGRHLNLLSDQIRTLDRQQSQRWSSATGARAQENASGTSQQ